MTTESEARCEEICRLITVAEHMVIRRQLAEARNQLIYALSILDAETANQELDRIRTEIAVAKLTEIKEYN